MSNNLFLDFLISQKILTRGQADDCEQKSIEGKRALSAILVQQGYLDASSLKKRMAEFQQFTLSLPLETLPEPEPMDILKEIQQVSSEKS
ncbi:MAG: hypothetical protein AABZ60_11795, partial [Planctomycetota bacterium]